MIRGVSLKITRKTNRILNEILSNVDVSKYNWYSIEDQKEAWSFSEDGETEFLEDICYQGVCFGELINKNHYIIFLKLEAYQKETNCYNVHSYEEFQNSECKIIILIYDCDFIEIYAKEEDIIQNIYENLQQKKFGNVEFITDVNDVRKVWDVL